MGDAHARHAARAYCKKMASLIAERIDSLAELETRNSGKTISGSKAEINQVVEDFEFYAGAVTKIMGNTIPAPPNFFNYTLKEPVGVCAQIIPWNYPAADGGLEGGAGACGWMHGRPQAGLTDAAHGACARADRSGSGMPAWRSQRAAGTRSGHRRTSRRSSGR